MTSSLKFAVLLINIFLFEECFSRDQRACNAWGSVKSRYESGIDVSCMKNADCTGVDCDGTYKYKGLMSGFQQFNLDFCVGVLLDTCDNPMRLYIYDELPSQNKSHQFTVTHNDSVPIPGAQQRIDPFHLHVTTLTPYIGVTMYNRTVNGSRFVRIGLRVQVRADTFSGRARWQPSMMREVIAPIDIPVPELHDNCIPVDKHQSFSCKKLTTPKGGFPTKPSLTTTAWTFMTTPAPKPITTAPPLNLTSTRTYLMSCNSSRTDACEMGENCTSVNSGTHSVCQCQKDFTFAHITVNGQKVGRCFQKNTYPQGTYAAKCDNKKRLCGANQVCHMTAKATFGRCICLNGLSFTPNKMACDGPKELKPEDAQAVIPERHHSKPVVPAPHQVEPSGPNTKAIIIGVTVTGGVLLLSALLGVVVYKYIKFKRQYGGHELLLQEEDVVI